MDAVLVGPAGRADGACSRRLSLALDCAAAQTRSCPAVRPLISLSVLPCWWGGRRVHIHGVQLRIRVGVHSGSTVGAVVGRRMPRFCLFGDSVNTASRMESHSVPGKIHMSGSTYALIKDPSQFIISSRGEIPVRTRATAPCLSFTTLASSHVCATQSPPGLAESRPAHNCAAPPSPSRLQVKGLGLMSTYFMDRLVEWKPEYDVAAGEKVFLGRPDEVRQRSQGSGPGRRHPGSALGGSGVRLEALAAAEGESPQPPHGPWIPRRGTQLY